jgi:hypothetical protein
MIWRIWALAHGRARRLLDRLRAFETPQDVTAKAFGKQACADALRGPQKGSVASFHWGRLWGMISP